MKRLFAIAAVASVALPLFAHDFWLMPSTFRPAAGEQVRVHLLVGEKFQGEEVGRNERQIEQFVARSDSGAVQVSGRPGSRPAGVARVNDDGLTIIGYRSRPTRHSDMPAAAFEAYLREEGLEAIIVQRRVAGHSGTPGRELFSRSAKTLIVRDGALTGFDAPLGFRFELVPLTDPHDPRSVSLVVKALYEGRPLAGVRISALHQGSDSVQTIRTGNDGIVRLELSSPGVWLIKSVHMAPAQEGAGADWESIWATLTFQR